MGPDDQGEGSFWLLDGRDARIPVGTVYKITLKWGMPPMMHWDLVESPPPDWFSSSRHSYFVVGSWTGGVFDTMRNVSTEESPNTWEARVRIGMSGMEWFRFVRDSDSNQSIYPAKISACNEDIAVCGPDEMCTDKSWRISGKSGEIVTLRLQVVDAHVSVKVLSQSMGTRTMQSVEGPKRHKYYVSGSFNDWTQQEMTLDEETFSTFRYQGTIGESCQEYFHITVDGDPKLAFYPEAEAAYPGDSIVTGPDEATETRAFFLFSLQAGAEFEISFDRNSVDRRKVVDVKWLSGRCDIDSMKLAYYNFYNMVPPGELSDKYVAVPELM